MTGLKNKGGNDSSSSEESAGHGNKPSSPRSTRDVNNRVKRYRSWEERDWEYRHHPHIEIFRA